MNRISIVGTSCSGKSTLAGSLSKTLNFPVIELDELYWEPGWKHVAPEEMRSRVDAATSTPNWISSGNYSSVRDLILSRCDTVIWLDYSLPVILKRAIQRTWKRVVGREPCCNGNHETWTLTFSRDSILLWVLTSYQRNRRDYLSLSESSSSRPLSIIRLKSPAETRAWLAKIQPVSAIREQDPGSHRQ